MLLSSPLIAIGMVLLQAGMADAQTKTQNGRLIDVQELDAFIQRQMDSLAIPGLSVAVIRHGQVVYHKLFGVKSLPTCVPLDDQAMFDAASLTKSVFAYFALKMVDRGMISLDTPLYKYCPYQDIQYDERYKLITARMVLSHSSGFPNWRRFNKDRMLDIKFTPGTDWMYSGEGYEYLAKVLAHLHHQKKDGLNTLIQEYVFGPLQMKHSSMVWNDQVAAHRVDGHIKGEVKAGWGISADKPGLYASYSLQSEALDYAHFLMALMRSRGLSSKSARDLFDIQIRSKTEQRAWGLGIEIEELGNGKLLYKHGGFNNNFSSGYTFSKDTRSGFVFFANNDSGNKLNDILRRYLAALFPGNR